MKATTICSACIHLSRSRREKISSVLAHRTSTVAVLLENLTDRGNENAVLRSMDAFGFQTLHRLKNEQESLHKPKLPPIRTDAGARKWITITDWSDTQECIGHLKMLGYRIACAMPTASTPVSAVDFTHKTVLAFGNEQEGISSGLHEACDVSFALPMCGFVQSLNVSVAVALTLYEAHTQRVSRLVSAHRHILANDRGIEATLYTYLNLLV